MDERKIKAVIFDMDGLIIDTEKLFLRYWVQAARELGFPMEERHVLAIRSLAREYAIPKLKEEVCEDFDYHAVRNLRLKLMKEHIDKYGIEEKPGLGELLEYLKINNYKIAIATASDLERTKSYMKMIHKYEYFDKMISAVNVAHGKPAPDIYLEAARQIGEDPKNCMALEDSPNGIRSAYGAGMYPVMVPDLTQPDEETKKLLYACVPTLADVIDILDKVNASFSG